MDFINEQSKQYAELIEKTLSKKRFTHSVNVADMCVRLAEAHGCDAEKAYTAGILHDIRKETPEEEQLADAIIGAGFTKPDSVELITPKLWHGISGAYYVRERLGITDGDIINAIRYHSVGRAGMSALEKIVYLADLVSVDRDYPEIEEFRALAFEDLDKAMYEGLKFVIQEVTDMNKQIAPHCRDAYDYYSKR